MGLKENFEEVRERINRAAAKFGHRPEDITLIAVTKTVEEDRIREAIQLGMKDMGENRVQEMLRKQEALQGARLHMIGQLQRNKVRQLPDSVVLVQSVDRLSLLEELERIGIRDDRFFEALLEVSIAGEEQKGGCPVEEIPSLLDAAEAMTHVRCRGFMTVAPVVEHPEESRIYFKKMRTLFEKNRTIGYNRNQLDILSMGMSHDFEVALEEGATMVRIGTALFGKRS